jgi:hypothetical protein
MEWRRGKGQTMSVVIMNRNKVHIGKRFFIIRSAENQLKHVLGMSYLSQTFRPLSILSSQNHHKIIKFSHFNLFSLFYLSLYNHFPLLL